MRWETTPDDIHGMIAAKGILTVHGGMTSHAAVVARGMGKPCVAGCEALSLDLTRASRGSASTSFRGRPDHDRRRHRARDLRRRPLVPPQINEDFETVLGWADEVRRLEVRANADTPEDAVRAREFGAEGIGLCRTEHMFFGDERLPVVQEMILARDEPAAARARPAAPDAAVRLRGDLRGDGRPPGDDPAARPAAARVPPCARETRRERDARADPALHESNPMLGTRGCRLGLKYPEIYEMQVRAIVRAANAVQERRRERRRSSRSCTRSSASPRSCADCAS